MFKWLLSYIQCVVKVQPLIKFASKILSTNGNYPNTLPIIAVISVHPVKSTAQCVTVLASLLYFEKTVDLNKSLFFWRLLHCAKEWRSWASCKYSWRLCEWNWRPLLCMLCVCLPQMTQLHFLEQQYIYKFKESFMSVLGYTKIQTQIVVYQ